MSKKIEISPEYKLEIVNPITYPGWNEKLLASPEYSVFHTSNWASVLSDSYGVRPYYFVHDDGNIFECLIPVMEIDNMFVSKKAVSLPFTDYCHPIVTNRMRFAEILPHILKIAKERNWKSIQFRDSNTSLGIDQPYSSYYRHFLPLQENEDAVFKRFRENYKSKIRKGLQRKISVHISQSFETFKAYYELHCLTRKSKGLPPQPYYYFKNVYHHIVANNMGFIVLASIEKKNIAGAVFFMFGEKAIYKYGASDLKCTDLFANYLIFWEAIQWLCRHGYKELCFGRTDQLHHGLIQFKDGWGAEKVEMYYYKYDIQKNIFLKVHNEKDVPGYSIIKWMPIPFLRILSSLVYRYNP